MVFQGDVEAIAAQSSKDLSKLIEQISGSLQYKAEYERLKQEQEATADESLITFNKKRGFNAEIKQYKAQVTEVERFNEMIEQRDQAVLNHVLWKLYHLENEAKTLQSEQHDLVSLHDTQNSQYKQTQEALDNAGEEYALENRNRQKLERRIKKREKFISEKQTGLLPVDEKITITKANLQRHQKRIDEVQVDYNRQKSMVEKVEKDIRTVNAAIEKFESDAQQQAQVAGMNLTSEDISEYEQLKTVYASQASIQQTQLDDYKRNLKTAQEELQSLQSKNSQYKSRAARLEDELKELQSRYDQFKARQQHDQSQLDAKKVELGEIVNERQTRSLRETKLNEQLRECVDELMRYNAHRRESEKERKLKEEVATLKRLIPGVKGMVYDLCRPKQRKYETAIATVLGKDFNSIIVDSFQTAQECINYLKEQRSGVATFIPLESVSYKPVNNSLRGISDQVRLAVDTVEYDPSLEAAIHYVCGSTIVCDDLNVAKYVRWTKGVDVKAVTLDGAVIHKAGLMTGGRVENNNSNQWADEKVEGLRKLKEKLTTELTELSRSKHSNREEMLKAEVSGLQMKLSYGSDQLTAMKSALRGRKSELDHVNERIQELQPNISQLETGVGELESRVESLQIGVSEAEDRIFGSFCQRIGVANIREYERAQSGLMNELSQKRLAFATQLSRLQKQHKFDQERLQDTASRIKNLEQGLSRDNLLLEQLQGERDTVVGQITQIEDEIKEITERLNDQKETTNRLLNVVSSRRDEVTKAQREMDTTRKRLSSLQEEIEKITSSRLKTLRNCKIEGLELPLIEGSLEALPLDEVYVGGPVATQVDDNGDIEMQDVTATPVEVMDNIEIDYAELDDELKQSSDEEKGEELEREIQTLSSNLERMVVNTRATERLEDAQSKLTEVDREFNNIRQKAREAKERFETVKKQRYERFDKAFKHISGAIDRIYKELTRTKSFPLGGTAYLSLEDEEEPYLNGVNYNAMPPMKRFCDMELLSGGEKTMAALALLFAIHSYHPSPFFVLDEVDAALDNANVNNIARYILQHAGPGFQFIVISLKNGLFENSHSLVGIYRNQDENSSKALTLDLQSYA